jgi:hypothetical protein
MTLNHSDTLDIIFNNFSFKTANTEIKTTETDGVLEKYKY